MPAPTVEQIRKAAAVVQALRGDELDARQRREIGDPLLALFAVLAKKIFPKDSEAKTVRRVRLMVASYLLRSEIEGTPAAPPDEASARRAVDAVAALSGAALDRRIDAEIGDALVTFLTRFCDTLMPEQEPDASAKKLHLALLAYLLRGDLAP